MLKLLGRHNMRPNHLHLMIEAPGHHKLITALYPEGDTWLESDAVFGVKKSLVVVSSQLLWSVLSMCLTCHGQKLEEVNDDTEAKKRGFPKGGSFKLLKHDIVLVPAAESQAARERFAAERAKNAVA